MNTGENEQGLRKILDMTRLISVVLLVIHLYYFGYAAFKSWGYVSELTDRLLQNMMKTGLFTHPLKSKSFAILFLLVSLVGARGKKEEKLGYKQGLVYMILGFCLFYGSFYLMWLRLPLYAGVVIYIVTSLIGYLFVLAGGTLLSRIIYQKWSRSDVFNKDAETFPQEERLLLNDYSINLPARYNLRGSTRKSWINIINPFRGLLVLGTPGSGKSYFVIRHVLTQHLQKGFSLFVYDFKFPDLSNIAYNHYLKNKGSQTIKPGLFVINFEDLSCTNRCNPLDPNSMTDITDATESARTILMGLNREWIRKQGDFFVESPINFLTAVIWFLRKYRDGEFCTLPHVIELMQIEYDDLFSVLRTQKEIEVLINPFVTAYLNDAMEQLEGQVAAAKIAMARLSSPQLYYVLSGNDFTLDINNPEEPKIVCMGNNPQKAGIYGAVVSLYVSRLIKQVNKKGGVKSSLIFDEFPTIYVNNMDSLMATARSNKVATTLGIQDFSQLKKDYGRDAAEVIMNIAGNIISGQVSGETAKGLSERFGKIMQDRQSFTINRTDTSVSRSQQMEAALPPSKISSLSSGEFVGIVSDDPECKIDLKAFHCRVLNDHAALKKEEAAYKGIPVIRSITASVVEQNYLQIKRDVQDIIQSELAALTNNPSLSYLLVRK